MSHVWAHHAAFGPGQLDPVVLFLLYLPSSEELLLDEVGDEEEGGQKKPSVKSPPVSLHKFSIRVVSFLKTYERNGVKKRPPASQVPLASPRAECVSPYRALLTSLVFTRLQVDTNVGRICVRLGWVPLEPLDEEVQLHLLDQ